MLKPVTLAICLAMIAPTVLAEDEELPVAPYDITNANAGAAPATDQSLYDAFNGEAGIKRIVDRFVDGLSTDPRTEKIFKASDFVRFRRTLVEQICFLTGGPCDYTGRDMASVHEDHGITTREFNATVEILQASMAAEGVSFRAQNKLLAKLAPMHREIVTR